MINSDMAIPGFIRIDPTELDAIDMIYHISRSPYMEHYLALNMAQFTQLCSATEEMVLDMIITTYFSTGERLGENECE